MEKHKIKIEQYNLTRTKIDAKVNAKLNAKVRTRQTEQTTTNRENIRDGIITL